LEKDSVFVLFLFGVLNVFSSQGRILNEEDVSMLSHMREMVTEEGEESIHVGGRDSEMNDQLREPSMRHIVEDYMKLFQVKKKRENHLFYLSLSLRLISFRTYQRGKIRRYGTSKGRLI
jgi:hypothetical protein